MRNLLDLTLPRGLQVAIAGGVRVLPASVKLRMSGRPQIELDGQKLDPDMQFILRLMELRGSPSFIRAGAYDPVAERRRVLADSHLSQGARTQVAAITDLEVPGGRSPLRARHYVSAAALRGSEPSPLLLYAHGGGWVVGDLDTHDELCRLICRHAGIRVLAVDYSLAPEQPWPAGVEDLLAATRWTLQHAERLGADPLRIAVGGDSAGGNLAAVTCQLLRQEGGPQVALQVLIYPAADFVDTWPSEELFATGFYLDGPSRSWCEERYLPADMDRADPRVSPLRGDLSELPPSIIITAPFDPLRDEGEAYARGLQDAGNKVVLQRVPGMIHGFMSMTGISRAARDAAVALAGMIRSRLVAPPQ